MKSRRTEIRKEPAKEDQEQADELISEKYKFILKRLKMDIRFFLLSLPEFVDMCPEMAAAGSWESQIMAAEIEAQSIIDAASEESSPNIETLVALLSCRDKILMYLVDSSLYQKAVLDSDLKRQRSHADGRMQFMSEHVRALASKTESLPETFIISSLPSALDDKRKGDKPGGAQEAMTQVPLPSQLLTLSNELMHMDKALRNIKFGAKVDIPHKPNGKTVGTEEIRKEISRVFDKCKRLEYKLQTSKAQRHIPLEQRMEQLNQKCAEKDHQVNQSMSRIHRLEGEFANLKADQLNIQRELQELNERNQKVTSENLPVLDQIDATLAETWKAVDRLSADGEMLSSMFLLQVDEYQSAVDQKDKLWAELSRTQRSLRSEKEENNFKEDELQKKDTLYQRTVVARQEILDDYHKQKEVIKEVEERQRIQNEDWNKLLERAEDRNAEIKHLWAELNEAFKEVDFLEQQKKGYLQEFKNVTGKPCGVLLEQFKIVPQGEKK